MWPENKKRERERERDEIHFVLDQHAQSDFYSTSLY